MRAFGSSSLTGHVRVVPALGRPHFPGASTPQASLLPQRNLLRAIEGLNLARNLKANGGRLLTKNYASVKAKPLRTEGGNAADGPYRRSSARRSAVIPEGSRAGGGHVVPMLTAMIPMPMDARK